MKRLILIILIIAVCLTKGHGQDVTVTAAFDTSRIYLGDQIFFTVKVNQPPGLRLEIQTFRDSLYKKIQILTGPVRDTTKIKNGALNIIDKYLVTSFDSGIYEVPPVYAEIKENNGIKRYYSEYSPLEVMRVKMTPPDSSSKIFDIIKPYGAPVTLMELIPWIFLAIAVAFIVFIIIRLLKRYRRTETKEIYVKNPDPAHVIAFRELEKLKNEKLWQNGEVKTYYSRLAEILRIYLENRYSVYSMEMTTSETLEVLLRSGFKKDANYALLKSVLNGSDLVKFAKYKPEPSENEMHFENAWSFVDATRITGETPLPVDTDEIKEVIQ